MATSGDYAAQVFASEDPHWHPDTHVREPPSPIPSSSASSLDATRHNERPSIQLKFSNSGAKIVNAIVVDPAGRPLYTISSDSKRTKLLFHSTEVATVDWDHTSPRMVFRGKKVKCKEWLRRVGPKTDSRIFVHGDSRFRWMLQSSRGFLIPANRPGLALARWRTDSRTDELHLQIFQEALVEPGLLEAIVLSIILLQSGHSFGDTIEPIAFMGAVGAGPPLFF